MNAALPIINAAYDFHKSRLSGKVTIIRITKTGKAWSYDSNRVVSMNINEIVEEDGMEGLLGAIAVDGVSPGTTGPDIIAQLQLQTKNTWLADKGNKECEWVASLMNDRITSVNDLRSAALDKALRIFI